MPIIFEVEIHVKPQLVSKSDLDSDEMNSSFPKTNSKPRESALQLSASPTPWPAIRARTFSISAFAICGGVPI
jgi:hypothetical protein